MTDDQFHDLMRMLRLILVALAVIAGLLAGFLWIAVLGVPLPPD
jgi:hypothetical protein